VRDVLDNGTRERKIRPLGRRNEAGRGGIEKEGKRREFRVGRVGELR